MSTIPEGVALVAHMEYGSKILDLKWKEEERTFFAYIQTDEQRQKLPGETSHVYAEVKIKCQAKADLDGKPVAYVLNTRRDVLKKWALSKGIEVFGKWDDIQTKGQLIMCKKMFYPSKRLR